MGVLTAKRERVNQNSYSQESLAECALKKLAIRNIVWKREFLVNFLKPILVRGQVLGKLLRLILESECNRSYTCYQ